MARRRKKKIAVREYPAPPRHVTRFFRQLPNLPTIGQIERALIEEALWRTEGNMSWAADIIAISREGLRKKLFRLQEW